VFFKCSLSMGPRVCNSQIWLQMVLPAAAVANVGAHAELPAA